VGVAAGDVIVELEGDAIASADDLREAIGARDAGTKVSLTVVRGGERVELEVTLAARPA
jgi:S1-C subfamily serine protease